MAGPVVWHSGAFMTLTLISTILFVHVIQCAELSDWVTQYCNAFNHQTVARNGSIYIDGGTVLFTNWTSFELGLNRTSAHGYNENLLKLDLTKDWAFNWNFEYNGVANQVYTRYDKTKRSRYGNTIPVLNRGALFAGPTGDTFWRYGGTVSYLNQSASTWRAPIPISQALWSWQASANLWTEHLGQDVFGHLTEIPNAGAHAELTELGLAFYINGQVDKGSAQERVTLNTTSYLVDGMIVLDLRNGTARNVSTSSMEPSVPTTRGAAIALANVGTHGIVIKMGGSQYASPFDWRYSNTDLLGFTTINVFDVGQLFNESTKANPIWYQQKATGDIPSPRVSFCLGVVSAEDNSSHHVYLFGGTDGIRLFADVYVLSLPAFVWTKVYTDPWGKAYHTCHVMAGSKFVSVGGNNDAGGLSYGCDGTALGIQIYDMNTNSWSTIWNATNVPYRVNSNVTQKIGGGPTGGANMKGPEGGFTDNRMANVFIAVHSQSTQTDQISTSHSFKYLGLALGVGLGIGLPLIFGLVFGFHRFVVKPYRKKELANTGGREPVNIEMRYM